VAVTDKPEKQRGNGAGRGGPARGYSWPPFQPGNQVARKHGGYSLLGIGERGNEICDSIREAMPVYSPADETVVQLLGVTCARIERANEAIATVDESATPLGAYLAGKDGQDLAPALHRLRQDLRAWIGLARRLSNDLGLTPTSRARLGLDIAAAQKMLGADLVERYGGRVE
jgi:Phage terminase, small subunit